MNKEFNLDFDSCLITRYKSKSQKLNLHQDNEDLFDSTYPICSLSVGDSRNLEFWDGCDEVSGKLIKNVELVEGTLVAMLPGCQEHLWHKVPRSTSPSKNSTHLRFAISFRKILSAGSASDSAHNTPQSSPLTPIKINLSAEGLISNGALTSTPIVNKLSSVV